MTVTNSEFIRLVRGYVKRKISWETVHQYAIQMEYENKASFPQASPLGEIHTIFLVADEKDDPQFRANLDEILASLRKLEGPNN